MAAPESQPKGTKRKGHKRQSDMLPSGFCSMLFLFIFLSFHSVPSHEMSNNVMFPWELHCGNH